MQDENKKSNIIFITLDGLRPRNLSCYGYSRNTSPNIDSLAKQGVLFNNFFSQYNCTHKSFLSILGGRHLLLQDFELYPSQREMKYFFETGGILLSEILKENGYKTYFLRKLYGWQKLGFDYYFEKDAQELSGKWNLIRYLKKIPLFYELPKYLLHNFYFIPKKLETKIRFNNGGEMATNKAIEIIKQNKENNFFLWLHYSDTHFPNTFPSWLNNKFVPGKNKSGKIFEILNSKEGYNKKDIEFLKGCWKVNDTVEDVIAKYDSSIFYNDFLIGKILDKLKEENLLENTIIFIFSDHGTSLDEHEAYFTTEGLYDVSFNIPLVIFGKGIPNDKKISALTQVKDLAPTILDLIGIKYDSLSFDGKTLLPLVFGKEKKIRESILIEEQVSGLKRRGIRTDRYKYVESPDKEHLTCKICNTMHGNIIDLFDLKKDPQENKSIAKEDKKLLIKMKIELEKGLKELKTINEKRRIRSFINKINLEKK